MIATGWSNVRIVFFLNMTCAIRGWQVCKKKKKATAQLVALHQFARISLLIVWNSLVCSLVLYGLTAKKIKIKKNEDMKIQLWRVQQRPLVIFLLCSNVEGFSLLSSIATSHWPHGLKVCARCCLQEWCCEKVAALNWPLQPKKIPAK